MRRLIAILIKPVPVAVMGILVAATGLWLISGGLLYEQTATPTTGWAEVSGTQDSVTALDSDSNIPDAPQNGDDDTPGSASGAADNADSPAGHQAGADKDPSISSELIQLEQAARTGGAAATGDFAAGHGLTLEDGRVKLVIEAEGTAAEAAAAAEAAGGTVETTYSNLVQALVPVENLGQLADSPTVSYLRPPQKPITTATSEGVADVGANAWQAAGHNGAGIRIAVMDPGFQHYTERVADGNLPASVTPVSFRADGNIEAGGYHGTGCAELVYDMAPDAQLYLINFETDVELGNAIDYLISQHVDVVSASWIWPAEFPGDGTGIINSMVDAATAAGVFWANAAGNAAQTHWSGPFTDINPADGWHEFSGADNGNDFYAAAGTGIYVFLTWNKWPATDQDYDLYLYKDGNQVAYSVGEQSGSQSPSEVIYYVVPTGGSGTYETRIENYSADGNASFELFAYANYNPLQYQVAAGSIAGQPADNAGVVTAGAVNVGTSNLAYYSSRGPTADARIKPDIAAPTGVSTETYGPHAFGGTSASTPHVAGAAALIKGAHPDYTAAQIRSTIESGATDLGDPGKDNLFGSGKLAMGAPPPAPFASYASWYDELSPGMKNWVLIANTSATEPDIGQVKVGGQSYGGFQIPAGGLVAPEFPGVMGGPVEMLSPGSGPLLVSQRVLYNGGFTEAAASPETALDSAYYMAWYDELSPGMKNWLLVANAGDQATTVEVYIGDLGSPVGTYSLAAGESIAKQYPGVMDGPVYVRSTNGQKLVVSARVIYQNHFSETPAIPASALDGEYRFNWYDQKSPGMKTWILAANPGIQDTTVDVYIGDMTTPRDTYDVPAGGMVTPTFPDVIDGPVMVKSGGGENLIVSERTLFYDSFEEANGTPPALMTATAWFTWYDYKSPGMKTWVLVSNPGATATSIDIYIGNEYHGPYPLEAGAVMAQTFLPVMTGPVKVVSSGQPVLASERTTYDNSFNEVNGVTP